MKNQTLEKRTTNSLISAVVRMEAEIGEKAAELNALTGEAKAREKVAKRKKVRKLNALISKRSRYEKELEHRGFYMFMLFR